MNFVKCWSVALIAVLGVFGASASFAQTEQDLERDTQRLLNEHRQQAAQEEAAAAARAERRAQAREEAAQGGNNAQATEAEEEVKDNG